MNGPWDLWSGFVNFLSAEFLLRLRANSGALVLLRALWNAFWVMVIAIILNSILDNGLTCNLDLGLIWKGFKAHPTWYALVLAAVYTALYTRYASQWQYLAKLYNDIKSKEIDLASRDEHEERTSPLINSWKAAFIADAYAMHLVTQESYATVIGHWLSSEQIREAYLEANDREGYNALAKRLSTVGVHIEELIS